MRFASLFQSTMRQCSASLFPNEVVYHTAVPEPNDASTLPMSYAV